MVEVILVLVIIALLVLIGFQESQNRKERAKFINALVSKTPEQLRDLDFVDKVDIELPTPEKPDLIPQEQLSDEEFAESIGAKYG